MGNGLKDYLDSSVRGGKAYNGSDKSSRGGSRFYDDRSAKSGRAYYGDDSSSRSGRSFYGDSSAHAGKVYEPIPEYTGRPSQDVYDMPRPQKSAVQAADGHSSPFANGNSSSANGQQQMQSPFANADGSTSEERPNSKRVHKLIPLT